MTFMTFYSPENCKGATWDFNTFLKNVAAPWPEFSKQIGHIRLTLKGLSSKALSFFHEEQYSVPWFRLTGARGRVGVPLWLGQCCFSHYSSFRPTGWISLETKVKLFLGKFVLRSRRDWMNAFIYGAEFDISLLWTWTWTFGTARQKQDQNMLHNRLNCSEVVNIINTQYQYLYLCQKTAP